MEEEKNISTSLFVLYARKIDEDGVTGYVIISIFLCTLSTCIREVSVTLSL